MEPLIQRFMSGDDYFVYDSGTNEIMKVEKQIWDILEYYGIKNEAEILERLSDSYSEEEIRRAIRDIHYAVTQQGLFMDNRPTEIRAPFSREELIEKLNNKVEHMILCITEQCNFRCHYCIYSGHYKHVRPHSKKHMNMATVTKAVDFFYNHCQKVEDPALGFYGGEPLLEFPLIQKVVDYTYKKAFKSINFSLTTNGSLLSDEVIRYFINNNFSLLVSIDGPESINDRYRRFANGKGTFQKIYQNLQRFREIDEDFFCSNIGLQVMIPPPADFEQLYEFFSNDPVLKGIRITISSISDEANTFFDRFSPEKFKSKGLGKLKERFRKDLIETGRCKNLFLEALFQRPLLDLQKRKLYSRHVSFHPSRGVCFPGVRRVLVKPNGDLLTCEKVNDSLVIGNIDKGYDLDRIFDMMEKYVKPLNQICLNCWAIRLCGSCFSSHFSNNGYDIGGKQKSCESTQESIIDALMEYCLILSENSNAFDYMKEIVIS